MAAYLEAKKAAVRVSYRKRLAEYETAHRERSTLKKSGDSAGAASVVMGPRKKKITTARPALPSILRTSATPASLRFAGMLSTACLYLEDGCIVPGEVHDVLRDGKSTLARR
jgi:hypothetical protein